VAASKKGKPSIGLGWPSSSLSSHAELLEIVDGELAAVVGVLADHDAQLGAAA
jgi:hypothetical protein